MKVFVDTNVVLEATLNRKSSVVAQQVLKKIEKEKITAYISTQSYCTMIYVLDRDLKSVGIYNPDKLVRLRAMLNAILTLFKVSELSATALKAATNDTSFNDIEDACQYYAAEKAKCDILITFNISDFKNAHGKTIVLSPDQFLH